MAGAAELGAEDGVGSGYGGGEVDVNVFAGYGVLLEPQGGDTEAVDDVLSVKVEVDLAVGGQDEGGGEDIVGAAGVGGVDAEGVAGAGVGELRAYAAEGVVGAGIAEVPGELHSGGLHLQGGGIGAGVAGGGPEAFGAEGEKGEEEGEGGQREVLDQGCPAVMLGGGVVGTAADEEAGEEEEVGEGEEGDGDPEIEGEMAVERGTVGGGVGRHEATELHMRRIVRDGTWLRITFGGSDSPDEPRSPAANRDHGARHLLIAPD